MSQLELIATTAFGLEAVVARELEQLGYNEQQVEDGKVTFVGDEAAVCRANLWLRSAERVLFKMAQFEATDFGMLFDETRKLAWSDWLPRDAAFPVQGKSVRSQLRSVPDCQSIVKKAIVEQMRSAYRTEWFEESGATYEIVVSILKDRATLTIDTSGAGLHKRGYRILSGVSPLKETLAAGLVQLSFWNRERPLIDPFCGTGTIPIEAALIGRNMAPGLNREFAAEGWPQIPASAWEHARTEARDLILEELPHKLLGSDIDEEAVKMARFHAERAGVGESVQFEVKRFADLSTHRKYGCVICNPPYGERSGELAEAEAIYREMDRVFKRLDTWSLYVLTSHKDFERLLGRRADKRRKLYNARIECALYQFFGPRPPWQQTHQ
jgi:putative N6-adenine-specific DNA methylase